MWTPASPGSRRSRRANAARQDRLSPGDTLARPQLSDGIGLRYGRGPGPGARADVEPLVVQRAGPPDPLPEPATPSRAEHRGGVADVEEQLRRLEVRLLAEAGGDPQVEGAVRSHMAEAGARFATARVRQFVPILVEREVRRRLREEPV